MFAELFPLQAQLIKTLAHPRRLEILQLLRHQTLSVTELHDMLDAPQANTSQHLAVLREAGILQSRRDGKQIYYNVASPKLVKACDLLRELLIEEYERTNSDNGRLEPAPAQVIDPVCKMVLSPRTAGYRLTHQDQEYFFCASGCCKKFQNTPEDYVSFSL